MTSETPASPSETSASLWRNHNFNIFWVGQSASNLGDAFIVVAIPLLVLQATGSVVQMGLVTAIFAIGWLAAGIFSGAMVDQVDRRKLMIACDIGRGLLYAAIPLSWWLFGPQMWIIYAVTLIGAVLGMIFQIAYTAAVSNLVDTDQIVEANSRLQTTWALSFVIGPILAGIVSGAIGPSAAIMANALSFFISAITIILIRLRPNPAEAPKTIPEQEKPSYLTTFLAGLHYLWQNPVLRAVTVIMAFVVFFLRASDDLLIYLLKTTLAQGDQQVGILFGMSGLGAVLAGVVGPTLRKRLGFGVCFLGGIAAEGLSLLAISLTSNIFIILFMAMVYSFVQTVRVIAMISVRQQLTPGHLMGRVTSAFLTIASVPGPIGITVLTSLASQFGAPAVVMLMGGAAFLIAAIASITPARIAWPERANVAASNPPAL